MMIAFILIYLMALSCYRVLMYIDCFKLNVFLCLHASIRIVKYVILEAVVTKLCILLIMFIYNDTMRLSQERFILKR